LETSFVVEGPPVDPLPRYTFVSEGV
jgi:hypothetical protein